MSDPGLLHGRRFFCREWALDELRRCLDARRAGPGRPTGVLVTGGPGAGKTALCAEVVRPDSEAGRASGLASRCLARHFCRREEPASGLAWRFVMALAEQLRASPLLPPEYGASVGRRSPPDPLSCQADPQVAFQRFVRIAVSPLWRKPFGFLEVSGLGWGSGVMGEGFISRPHSADGSPILFPTKGTGTTL
ncbi:ankyrin repeat domain-containing protein 50-like, partial [Hippocampus comes]|uniref:ankyrin repeat domain-containing protein 50-like n=1 Tax=Hippocampus comes TaxID=109280 RepID=UPI00094F0206